MVSEINIYPYCKNQVHDIASITKSIVSMLIEIAIDKEFILNEDVYITDILKDMKNLEGIKIKHLLSMTSGIIPCE